MSSAPTRFGSSDHKASPPQVTIGISTLSDRVAAIDLPAPKPGLSYLILVQGSGFANDLPMAKRPDVALHYSQGFGVAQSRSDILALCQTPLLHFMDDDISIQTDGILALAAEMAASPSLALCLGYLARRDRGPVGPAAELTVWNTGRTMTPEIMVRVKDIRKASVTFDPQFGLNGTYPIGDEYVFVTDLLKCGCQGLRFPIEIGRHEATSTGDNWQDPIILMARAAVLRRIFGGWSYLIRPAFALKHRRRIGSLRAMWNFSFGRID